ncbi:putative Response regulator [Gammaproteobacteria bacterium]
MNPRVIKTLVVDDDQNMRQLVGTILRHQFPEIGIIESCDGMRAMRELLANKIDIILCDLYMPGMNGLELLEVVRSSEHERIRLARFLMITSASDKKMVESARGLKVDDYILKPFNGVELCERLGSILRKIDPNN